MAAKPTPEAAAARRDIDGFDAVCDHLLVIDRRRGAGAAGIVGTYRLIRREAAARHGGFYSAAEYDIAPLVAYPGNVLELGRSCVDAQYRNRPTMQLLWRGIASYVFRYEIALMFGCAKHSGHRIPRAMATSLSLSVLPSSGSASLCARARCRNVMSICGCCSADKVDPRVGLAGLPPMIKGYLRLGGFVGDGAVIDHEFHTTDVCIIVKTDLITDKYAQHYQRTAREPGPG